jgi:type IV pilus assembly protein PilV
MTPRRDLQRGISLIEVMVSILITAFGLLALAGLMGQMQVAETEGYQRAQALILLESMTERINAAVPATAALANTYVTGTSSPLGTGDGQPATCTALTGAALDFCEWSNELKGAAEKSGANSVGAMIGARGCIELLDAPDPTQGICRPGRFRVSVVWQGLVSTAIPATQCGAGLYGNENERRVIAAQTDVGTNLCLP